MFSLEEASYVSAGIHARVRKRGINQCSSEAEIELARGIKKTSQKMENAKLLPASVTPLPISSYRNNYFWLQSKRSIAGHSLCKAEKFRRWNFIRRDYLPHHY